MSDLPALTHRTSEYLDSAPVGTPSGTPSVFAELVCADPELLRAEFEALIAANCPTGDGLRCRRPPRRTGPSRIDRAQPTPEAVSSSRSGSGSGGCGGRIGTECAARERGPPDMQAWTRALDDHEGR